MTFIKGCGVRSNDIGSVIKGCGVRSNDMGVLLKGVVYDQMTWECYCTKAFDFTLSLLTSCCEPESTWGKMVVMVAAGL